MGQCQRPWRRRSRQELTAHSGDPQDVQQIQGLASERQQFPWSVRTGGERIEQSPTRKYLSIDDKLDMCQQCALPKQKANWILACIKRSIVIRLKEAILSFALMRPPGVPCPGRVCSTKETETCWSTSRGGPQKWLKGRSEWLWKLKFLTLF